MSVKTRRYIEHISQDPYPGLDSDNYWPVSGNTVAYGLQNTNNLTLYYSSGQELSSISKLAVAGDGSIDVPLKTNLKTSFPIHQIAADPHHPLVLVRQRNNITVLLDDLENNGKYHRGCHGGGYYVYFEFCTMLFTTSININDKNN